MPCALAVAFGRAPSPVRKTPRAAHFFNVLCTAAGARPGGDRLQLPRQCRRLRPFTFLRRPVPHPTPPPQVDNRGSPDPILTPEQAARLCDRNFGIGGDGVIFALPPVGDTDLAMRIYNSDGSEPEMCGNGIRCLARFVADVDGATSKKYRIHTLAGACCQRWRVALTRTPALPVPPGCHPPVMPPLC
jgi:hypothetical protein